jgi:hypothetical protein
MAIPIKEWSIYTRDSLKLECEKRSLTKSGTKIELIERLEEFESNKSTPLRSRHSQPQRPLSRPAFTPPRGLSKPSGIDHAQAIDLSEEHLEQICRENWSPYTADPSGIQRRANIKAAYELKRDDAIKKRNTVIDRARAKCDKELDICRRERENKLGELEAEVRPNEVKRRAWGPAFRQLKVRGIQKKEEEVC